MDFLYFMADIDECLEGTFKCDVSMECKNIHGSYKCVCGEGLYWIDNKCQGKTKKKKLLTLLTRNCSHSSNPRTFLFAKRLFIAVYSAKPPQCVANPK